MKYDFFTRMDRKNTGAYKWEDMYKKNPQVSPGVVPFSTADMEFPIQGEIAAGLGEVLERGVLGYARPAEGYTKAVISWMKRRHDWEIEAEWIIQSPGVVPAFFNGVQAFTEEGDGVIIMPPVYAPFGRAVTENGRKLVENPLVDDGKTYRIDYDDLEEKARDPKNKLLIFCSPHNPVGRVWKKEELLRVADICNRCGVLAISDEIHADLLFPGVSHTVYAALSEEAAQNCVVCTAPSKTFNLAGLQVSNIIIPNRKLRSKLLSRFKKNAVSGNNVLGLRACEIAYTRCEEWLDELLELIAANYRLVKNFMAKNFPMVTVYPMEGTYLVWMDFRSLVGGPTVPDYKALEEFMIRDAELFFAEGAMFGVQGCGFERMNIACPAVVLEEALERLLGAARRRGLIGG
jgi:putative C-S lyase